MPEVPHSHFQSLEDLGGGQRRFRQYAYPRWRPAAGGGWERTTTEFRADGSQFVADGSVHALSVSSAGECILRHLGQELRIGLRGVGPLLPLLPRPTATTSGNTVTFSNIAPATDLIITYVEDQVRLCIETPRPAAGPGLFSVAWDFVGNLLAMKARLSGAPVRVVGQDWRTRGAPRTIAIANGVLTESFDPSLLPPGQMRINATLTYQEGVGEPPYSGCTDTFIAMHVPNDNFGSNEGIYLDWWWYDFQAHSHGLFRWTNLGDLPEGDVVVAAEIRLWVLNFNYEQPASGFDAYKILAAWANPHTSWNERTEGIGWAEPGCESIGVDRSGDSSGGELWPDTADAWWGITCNATGIATVQSWYDSPATNYGLLLRTPPAGDNRAAYFASADWATAAQRPVLEVTTAPGGPATHTVSGTVTNAQSVGLDGITIAFTGTGASAGTDYEATTAGGGLYSQEVVAGWTGTAVPSGSGLAFTPTSRNYSNVQADDPDEDYSADAADTPTITSGTPQCDPCTAIDVVASAYSGNGTHDKSDWECRLTEDPWTVVDSSYDDAVNLTTWTAGGLALGTEHEFRTRQHDEAGWSEWSAWGGTTTTASPPAAPTLVATFIGPASVQLQFTDAYAETCPQTTADWWVDTDTPPDEGANTVESEDDAVHLNVIVLNTLAASTTYYAQGRRNNACGDGTKSNIVEFETPAAGDPDNWPKWTFESGGNHFAIKPDLKSA